MAAIIPPTGCDTTCRNIFSKGSASLLVCFLPNVNSVPFDYFARQKVIGMHLGAGVFEQLPVLPPLTYSQSCAWSAQFADGAELVAAASAGADLHGVGLGAVCGGLRL